MKIPISRFALPVCLVLTWAASASAQTTVATEPPAPARIDIDKVTCRDLMNANPLDRSAVVMFYWGYAAAKSGASSFKTGTLRTATEHLVNLCRQQPSMTVLSAVRTVDIKAF